MNKRWNYFSDDELRVILQALSTDSSRIAMWLQADVRMELGFRHPEKAKGETA